MNFATIPHLICPINPICPPDVFIYIWEIWPYLCGAYMLHIFAVSIDSIVAQHRGRQLGWGWTQLRLCPPLTLNFQSIVSIIHSIALVDAIAHKSSSHTLTWYLPISWPRASACTLLCSTMPTLLYSTLHTLHTRVFLKWHTAHFCTALHTVHCFTAHCSGCCHWNTAATRQWLSTAVC